MNALVTGAAGFVGSHLCGELLDHGYAVRGVDCFTDYYPRARKCQNVEPLLGRRGFRFTECDLHDVELGELLDDIDVVFHLAGQPGVRPSWGRDFGHYVRQNISVTQRLLEAVKPRPIRKLVYASSSSVYGDAECFPTPESVRPAPVSPYGVTKLAAEHLCELYRVNFGIPTVSLRLFTVYGPRQRPDMAFSRLVEAALRQRTFELYGDGSQTRDFTYVADVVSAMRDAALSDWCGVANIGGGSRTSMKQVIAAVEALCGPVDITVGRTQQGDVRHTAADTRVAATSFGYAPRTSITDGIRAMVAWARDAPPWGNQPSGEQKEQRIGGSPVIASHARSDGS
ncbi:MAG: NAD-dependent epimerase/dehydratase family protein [Actinobacteria bacterium]|nr:MAG: NAD-dependent epimerase/dehydratase family protein [Actinomycetota bacterium]